jgi:hypothetical protein
MTLETQARAVAEDETDLPCTSCHDTGFDWVMERFCCCEEGIRAILLEGDA